MSIQHHRELTSTKEKKQIDKGSVESLKLALVYDFKFNLVTNLKENNAKSIYVTQIKKVG
jgi:hypothetical protein